MDSIVFGRYLPIDSFMHRLDPRAKLIGLLLLLIAIFIPAGALGYILLGLVVLDCVYLSKLKISYIMKAMKPMLFMMVFLLVVNVLVVKTGDVLFTVFNFVVYSDAVFQTLYIVIRLLLMVSMTTILTATTKPLDLTLGIEELLSPFKKIGVPAHEIAMMISIALRFIPTLIEETQRIMKAQKSRGVDLEEGKMMEKIRAMISLIVPLFISAFQRAEDLANAMEARGYVPDAKRTRYNQLVMKTNDYITIAFSVIVLILCICIAFTPMRSSSNIRSRPRRAGLPRRRRFRV